MKKIRIWSTRAMLAISGCLPGFATAQNAVSNPDFDSDVVGWTPNNGATLAWDASRSIVGAAASGSLSVTGVGSAQAFQCISGPFTAGNYDFGGWINVPVGQAGFGTARIGVLFFADVDCTGSPTAPMFADVQTATGTWLLTTETFPVASVMGSARIAVTIDDVPGPPSMLTIYFDGIRLGPQPTVPVELQSFNVE